MSTRTYRFRPDALFGLYVSVSVSTTRKEMSGAYRKWGEKVGHPTATDPKAAAYTCSRGTRQRPVESAESWTSDHFAAVFLNEADLRKGGWGEEIIVHESVHAALAYERVVQRFSMDYSGDMEHEERLCYAAGRIVVGIRDVMKKDRKRG